VDVDAHEGSPFKRHPRGFKDLHFGDLNWGSPCSERHEHFLFKFGAIF
jgi:hypothetical protein